MKVSVAVPRSVISAVVARFKTTTAMITADFQTETDAYSATRDILEVLDICLN